MGSVDRYLVLDIPATYLFLILISSSYVGRGWPAEAASDARRRNPQWITLSFRAAKIRQIVASGRPRTAGAALAGVPAPQEQLWRASPLRRNALAAVPAPQEQIFPGLPSS
jgi:hypothetical protein